MTKEKFKSLVLPSKEKLFRIALGLLGNRQEAEDTLQDAMLKLWDIRERLAEYQSVEALAVTMTKNLCLDKLRSYRSRKQEASEVEKMNVSNYELNPAEETELGESMHTILAVMQTLSEQQRLIMHLRDIEHYRYDEIEEITGLTRNNIRVHLSRARKHVREVYLKRQNYEHRKN